MVGLEYGFKEDPPDLARVFTNRSEPPDISMRDNDEDVGYDGHALEGFQCS